MPGMGWEKIRFLVPRPRKGAPLWLWMPARLPRAQLDAVGLGPRPLRHPDGRAMSFEEARLEAKRLNDRLDAWRRGELDPGAGRAYQAPQTTGRLIDAFYESAAWSQAGKGTQRQYRAVLEALREISGDMPVAALTTDNCVAFVDGYRTLAMKRYARAALSRFLSWCKDELKPRAITVHPLIGATGMKLAKPKGRIAIWSLHMRARMVAIADQLGWFSIGDAIVLGLYFGQRRIDILSLRWPPLHDDLVTVDQVKMRRYRTSVVLPLRDTEIPELDARLADMQRRQLARLAADRPGATVLPNQLVGRPMIAPEDLVKVNRADGGYNLEGSFFNDRFTTVRMLASLSDAFTVAGALIYRRNEPVAREILDTDWREVRFQDLRDTCVTALWDAGCSVEEICSVTGHTPKQIDTILRHYLKMTGRLARKAFSKRGRSAE